MVDFLNSNFFSAFFGAIAGALAAAWLARYAETRRQLRDEILACNVAINQCASIANAFVSAKRQAIRATCARYAMDSIFFFFAENAAKAGKISSIKIEFDFYELASPWTSIDALNSIVSTRIWSAASPSSLAASLTLAIHNQRSVTEHRNTIIQKIAKCPPDEKTARYFGTALPGGGGVDTSFSDLMKGLHHYTEDCIYYSALLAAVLTEHGNELAAKLGKTTPKIKALDLSQVQHDGLLPDPAHYPAFEREFRPKKPEIAVIM